MQLTIGTSLVYQVDGLIRQEPFVDELGTGTHGKLKGFIGIIDPVEVLVVLFQLFQDF